MIALVALFLPYAPAAKAAMAITTIASTNYTQDSDIILGSDGFPRLAYYDLTNGDLVYVRCTNISCSGKVTTTVDSSGTVGYNPSIRVGSDGFARIAYIDDTNDDLKYARCTNADCTSKVITVLDTAACGNAGCSTIDLELDSSSYGRIAYSYNYSPGTSYIRYIQCTNNDCTTKNTANVDSDSTYSLRDPGMTLNSSGYPRFVYASYYNPGPPSGTYYAIEYAYCTNAACTGYAQTTIIPSGGNYIATTGLSIAAGSDGYARLIYMHDSTAEYVRCQSVNCSTRVTTAIPGVSAGVQSVFSMFMGSDGFARIALIDSGYNAKYITCTNADCSAATVSTIESGYYGYPSLALGGDNSPYITYTYSPTLDIKYAYSVGSPTISGISPNYGPPAGGTSVTITGTNFVSGVTTLTIGGTSVTPTVVNSTTITASTPAHAVGAVNVVVANGALSATLTSGYTYVTQPTVSAISPDMGAVSGGDSVTVTGTGFGADTALTIGGTPATIGSYDPTHLYATTPAHAAGAVNVVVTNSGILSDTLTAGFEFVTAPVISSISPDKGYSAGGAAATITGSNFGAGSTVTLGGASATVDSYDATHLNITTPAHAAGAVDVVVTNSGVVSDTLTDGFTYKNILATSVTGTADSRGYSSVVVNGQNFDASATVTIDGQIAKIISRTSTALTVVVPAHAAGTADVVVTGAAGSDTIIDGLTYNEPVPEPHDSPVSHNRTALLSTSVTADPTVDFSWQTAASTTAKAIKIQVCTTGNDSYACTTPAGASFVGSTLGSVGGQLTPTWNYTVNSAQEVILVKSAGNSLTVGSTQTLSIDGFTNPSYYGSFYFRVFIYSDEAAANLVEMGAFGTSTAKTLTQSAEVVETLLFRVANSVNDDCTAQVDIVDPDDSTEDLVTLSDNPLSLVLGSTGSAQLCVATNAKHGFTIAYRDELGFDGHYGFWNGVHQFNPGGITQFASTPGSEQFGFNVNPDTSTAALLADLINADYGTTGRYSYNDSGDAIALASKTAPTNPARYTLQYLANISQTTPAGTYTAHQIFVVTATF